MSWPTFILFFPSNFKFLYTLFKLKYLRLTCGWPTSFVPLPHFPNLLSTSKDLNAYGNLFLKTTICKENVLYLTEV